MLEFHRATSPDSGGYWRAKSQRYEYRLSPAHKSNTT
jgi:hypothetical protein